MKVMRFRPPGRDELVSHEKRKREIRQPALVQVPELTAAVPKFSAVESMAAGRDTWPRGDFADDGVLNGFFGLKTATTSLKRRAGYGRD
jgi:hypothetical protein